MSSLPRQRRRRTCLVFLQSEDRVIYIDAMDAFRPGARLWFGLLVKCVCICPRAWRQCLDVHVEEKNNKTTE